MENSILTHNGGSLEVETPCGYTPRAGAAPVAERGADGRLFDPDIRDRVRRSVEEDNPTTRAAVENLIHLLRLNALMLDALSDRLAAHDLSLAKYNLLIVLKIAPKGRLTLTEIGQRMSVTGANITRLMDGLERDGLVRRVTCLNDRRAVFAELTPQGMERLHGLIPQHHAYIQKLWQDLSEEESLQLTHLMVKLRQSALAASTQEEGQQNQ